MEENKIKSGNTMEENKIKSENDFELVAKWIESKRMPEQLVEAFELHFGKDYDGVKGIKADSRLFMKVAEIVREYGRHVTRKFKVGDVIAYRTLEDNKPEWVAWEVGEIDDEYLYEKGDKEKRDNIAIGSAFLVKAVEDKR